MGNLSTGTTKGKGMTMQSNNDITIASAPSAKSVGTVATARDATKDAGRVHIGGGCMHFSDVIPAREATKDAGRVHIGGGCMHF
jgi:hypothetical protein